MIKQIVLSIGVLLGVMAVVVPSQVAALDPCDGNRSSAICQEIPANPDDAAQNVVAQILGVLFYVIGIIAVIVIIVGGIRYTTADGDSGRIKSAKDTILYAVVGLVVALLAGAIVSFVLGNIG